MTGVCAALAYRPVRLVAASQPLERCPVKLNRRLALRADNFRWPSLEYFLAPIDDDLAPEEFHELRLFRPRGWVDVVVSGTEVSVLVMESHQELEQLDVHGFHLVLVGLELEVNNWVAKLLGLTQRSPLARA
jgi:hypothetical protein